MCLLCSGARNSSKYREDKTRNLIILSFEGFDLIELDQSFIQNSKDFKDFRDVPRIVEETLFYWGRREKSLVKKEEFKF